MNAEDCSPLVVVTRGEIVESMHFGGFVLVDSSGRTLACEGNPQMMTYPRSSMKPLQALPFIEMGGQEAYDLTDQEIAMMCASHSGTNLHVEVLRKMHEKIGISEDDLACGVHWPGDADTRTAMIRAGETPTPFRHNCSGKHTGMLAQARLRGLEKTDYLDPHHPVQVKIREAIAEMVTMEPDTMPISIDGCSAPVYGIPLYNMAYGIAKLADPSSLEENRAEACQKITRAMMSHPEMVAGLGKFDTDLMKAGRGRVFSKGGAEGYQVLGVMPGATGKNVPGLGIALKISDGDSGGRARTCVSVAILAALGVLNRDEIELFMLGGVMPVKNWRKLDVGEIRPAFSLKLNV